MKITHIVQRARWWKGPTASRRAGESQLGASIYHDKSITWKTVNQPGKVSGQFCWNNWGLTKDEKQVISSWPVNGKLLRNCYKAMSKGKKMFVFCQMWNGKVSGLGSRGQDWARSVFSEWGEWSGGKQMTRRKRSGGVHSQTVGSFAYMMEESESNCGNN